MDRFLSIFVIDFSKGKHPHRNEPHKKFANYSFDPKEFMRLLRRLAAKVTVVDSILVNGSGTR